MGYETTTNRTLHVEPRPASKRQREIGERDKKFHRLVRKIKSLYTQWPEKASARLPRLYAEPSVITILLHCTKNRSTGTDRFVSLFFASTATGQHIHRAEYLVTKGLHWKYAKWLFKLHCEFINSK